MKNTYSIDFLKKEVLYVFGRKVVTSRDCIDLAESVYKKCGLRVNSNTLRRIFGLVKSDYSPSVTTLNILSMYCGVSSVEELENYRSALDNDLKSNSAAILQFLSVIFKNVTNKSTEDPAFSDLTHTAIEILNHNSNIAVEFQRHIAQVDNANKVYFEHFVNIDKLDSFYGNGLRYYMAANKEDSAQIFGHSLLCLRNWLKMDCDGLRYHHDKLLQYNITDDIPLFICSHYYAAKLFYADAADVDAMDTILEAGSFYQKAKTRFKDRKSLLYFEITMCEALILTNYYSDALFYICESKKYPAANRLPDAEFVKSLNLYRAIALMKNGDRKKASELYDDISPIEFCFVKKQFQTILYFSLGMKLDKIRAGEEQLDFLIDETGFKKMKTFLAAS